MSSLRPQDRKSLCRFTFADGRQCRVPRSPGHPHLCFDHARKDSQARAADKLARELSYFFSGPYLSACDLSAALGRLIAGVARGDIKPRSARTLAYLSQTLLQTIHLAQDEYINAFDTDGWRRAVRNSVRGNHDYLFPPAPKPPQDQAPQPAPTPQPAPSPHAPMPPTSAEFVQHVLAGRNLSRPGRETGEGRAPHVVAGLETGDSPASNHVSPSATTPARRSQPTPSSPLPPARPTTPPIQSSNGAQHSPQPPSEPQPPIAAAPSAARQEPRPAAAEAGSASGFSFLLTPLEATLTQPPAAIDSKPLTTTLSPLSATLTKNRGRGA